MMASTFFSGSRSVTHKVEPTTVIVAARAERGTFGVDDRDAVNVGLGEGSEELSQRSGAIERQPRVTSLPRTSAEEIPQIWADTASSGHRWPYREIDDRAYGQTFELLLGERLPLL
jgi:hypothetical protein